MTENWLYTLLIELGLANIDAQTLAYSITLFIIFLIAALATHLVRRILLASVTKLLKTSKHSWISAFLKHGFFKKLSWFVPVAIVSLAIDVILPANSSIYVLTKRLTMSCFVIVVVFSITALLGSLNDTKSLVSKERRQLLRSYTDVGRILAYLFGFIFIISIFTGRSPWGIISVLGGLTAITLLIFKDAILGFVASIQMSTMDLVRLGDWIEMNQYGADGEVIEISIHSVKVQNWDKTITSIPTYSLVSNSFRNWRGMSESGGRRIKRALHIDQQSIRFCDTELLTQLENVALLQTYLKTKHDELTLHNKTTAQTTSVLNGRRQTNIGVFRAYIIAYLKNNPNVRQNMTFLVRQLAPGGQGLPIEIYVFSKNQVWAEYEAIQADIFDHLLAAAPEFGLRIFQEPTGYDMRQIARTNNSSDG